MINFAISILPEVNFVVSNLPVVNFVVSTMPADGLTLSVAAFGSGTQELTRLPLGGVTPVRVSKDKPPFRPPFFISGTSSGWVLKCHTPIGFYFL